VGSDGWERGALQGAESGRPAMRTTHMRRTPYDGRANDQHLRLSRARGSAVAPNDNPGCNAFWRPAKTTKRRTESAIMTGSAPCWVVFPEKKQ
jgi:hypothetical protein